MTTVHLPVDLPGYELTQISEHPYILRIDSKLGAMSNRTFVDLYYCPRLNCCFQQTTEFSFKY